MLDPRRHLLDPFRGVSALAFTAEVNALAVAFAECALQGIAVRPFERNAVFPERAWAARISGEASSPGTW